MGVENPMGLVESLKLPGAVVYNCSSSSNIVQIVSCLLGAVSLGGKSPSVIMLPSPKVLGIDVSMLS